MPDNSNLNRARVAINNDEYYTRYVDIERELNHYVDQFKGKVVYCNCDDPRESQFVRFFLLNFKRFGLKRLIASCYKPMPSLFGESATPVYLITDRQVNESRLAAFIASNVKPLKSRGDFRSYECVEFLKQADIVVTNPPFSLFREFVQLCLDYGKQFLVIGSLGALSYDDIIEYSISDRIRIGYYKVRQFVNGDGEAQVSTFWFTTLQVQDKPPLQLSCKYKESEYPKYDNYDAIEVSKLEAIPVDYRGAMGVPVTFLTVWCRKQFDVLGGTGIRFNKLRTRTYSKKENDKFSNGANLNRRACLKKDGIPRLIFARVLIKWK